MQDDNRNRLGQSFEGDLMDILTGLHMNGDKPELKPRKRMDGEMQGIESEKQALSALS